MKTFIGLFLFFSVGYLSMMAEDHSNKLSLDNAGFVENKGQVRNQHDEVNNDVRFTYSGRLFSLQLKDNSFSYELFEVFNSETGFPESGLTAGNAEDPEFLSEDYSRLRSHRIDVKLIGANSSPEIIAQDPTGATFNFYIAQLPESGITGVQSYNRIVYKNIYRGIDLVFSAPDKDKGSHLKYEWIIHPGADPSRIKLQYAGATGVVPSAEGGFQLMTSTGVIEEGNVIAYLQDDHLSVVASYRFNENKVSYKIAPSKNKTLIIDPNILWSTYYGGDQNEDINNGELAVDGQGKVIITGNTNSTLYIASTGAHQTTFGGGFRDGFAAKFKPNGKLNWATYYGGADKDEGHAVVTDPSNNVYIGGLTGSQTGISTVGSHQAVFGGQQDALVVKFNNSGVRQWGTYIGGSTQDEILDLECDALGNIYFTGYTVSPNQIATPGAHQDTINNSGGNNGDAFLGQFTPGGKLVWCSYSSGPLQDRAHGIALGKNGKLYIQGTAESTTQFATTDIHQSVYGGGISDAFVSKWDTNGNFFWCSYYGGPHEDHGRGVKTDADGNVYIFGWTDSESGIGTPGAVQPDWFEAYEINGDRKPDGYLAKFLPNGTREWGTYYGGGGKEQNYGLAVDKANDLLYAIGYTTSMLNISTPDSYQPVYTGSSDGYIVKFNTTGTRIWGTYFGAGDVEELHGAALDPNGFLLVLLSTDGSDFPATPGTYQSSSYGEYETVVVKFSVADNCYDAHEPNETNTTAKIISAFSDTTLYGYTGAISTADDADWYRIKLSPTNLKIVLTDLPADYNLKLYKLNGQLIASSITAGTADETIIFNNINNGNYLIQIDHSASAFDAKGCYLLKPMTSSSPWFLKPGEEIFSSLQNSVQVNIFPNPCNEHINMKITSSKTGEIKATLYNLVHQPVMFSSFEIIEGNQSISLPVNHLPAGIYLLEFVYNGENISMKVAIQ